MRWFLWFSRAGRRGVGGKRGWGGRGVRDYRGFMMVKFTNFAGVTILLITFISSFVFIYRVNN